MDPCDLEPQGEPETVVEWRYETHLGLVIRGTSGGILGILGVRCERCGSERWPLSAAIIDTPIAIDTHATGQSNPRRIRRWDPPHLSNGEEA